MVLTISRNKTGLYFLLIQVLMFFFFVSCSSVPNKNSNHTKSITKHSEFLKIVEKDSSVYITIIHPERTNKTYNYFISKNPSKKTPIGFVRLDIKTINFLVLSTTHIGMLAQLGQLDKIKGTCSKDYIHNHQIRNKLDKNQIMEFGNETNLSIEKIISLRPKSIIYSGFTNEFSKNKELIRLGIQPIPNFDWKESHPIGRAEWILFFGYITGTDEQAKNHLKNVETNYNNLKIKAIQSKSNPKIIMGSKIGDFWFGPAGQSYAAHLLLDAKANYIYKDTKGIGSVEYNMEKVYVDSKESEFWINPGFSSYQLLEMNNPKAKLFSAFQNRKVFCYTHNPNKYWELSSIHPDWVLSDLIKIMHPESQINNPFYFYKALE
jgi:iron complex transport system substrate-binding protein